MQLVRRLYVYLICGVSLIVLSIGLTNLLGLAIAEAWASLSGANLVVAPGTDVRQELSLFLALVAVSFPIWLLHWYLAERWAHREDDDSDRASGIRALFFALVLAGTLQAWGTDLHSLADLVSAEVLDVSRFFSERDVTTFVANLIILFGFWIYHAWIRERDARAIAMSGVGVWPVRLYIYGAALFGAILMAIGVADLLRIAIDATVTESDVLAGDVTHRSSVSYALPNVLVGGILWGIHWYYSLRLLHGGDWRAESERHSALRRAYLYVLVFVGVVATLVGLSLGLTELLRAMFGVGPGPNEDPLWAQTARPVAIALPFTLFWITHRRIIGREAERFVDQPAQISVARLYTYIVAFASLAFFAVGLAYLLGVLIQFFFESAQILDTNPEWVPEQISLFLSFTVIAGVVWLWFWWRAQRRVTYDPRIERAATIRRVYIYLALTASTLAMLVALAIVLYQALQVVLGVRTTEGIASDVGTLVGIVIVAGGLVAYHLLILRGDLGYEPVAPSVPVDTGAAPSRVHEVSLTLRGPETIDLQAVLADLRRHLPENVELRTETVRTAPSSTSSASRDESAEPSASEPSDEDSNDNPRIFH